MSEREIERAGTEFDEAAETAHARIAALVENSSIPKDEKLLLLDREEAALTELEGMFA